MEDNRLGFARITKDTKVKHLKEILDRVDPNTTIHFGLDPNSKDVIVLSNKKFISFNIGIQDMNLCK